jgi:hypothetical protein
MAACCTSAAVLCWQVGDSISCFVMDVEDGTPLLTQRLTEEADNELAEFAGGCGVLAGKARNAAVMLNCVSVC